jgi:hypothetical protein
LKLKYPRWQQAVEAAILEFDPTQLAIKLQDAERAISKRLVELASEHKREDDLQALSDACSTIRVLENHCRVLSDGGWQSRVARSLRQQLGVGMLDRGEPSIIAPSSTDAGSKRDC